MICELTVTDGYITCISIWKVSLYFDNSFVLSFPGACLFLVRVFLNTKVKQMCFSVG